MSGNTSKYSKQKLKKFSADVAKEYFFERDYPALLQPSRIEYMHMLLNTIENNKVPIGNINVLGVGCGPGFNLLLLKELGFEELVGIDVLPPSYWPMKKPPSFDYLTFDVCSKPLPFKDEHFNVVLLIDVLEHLYDPAPLLTEIQRILKPKGLLVVRTPNIANLNNRLLMLCGRSPNPDLEGFFFKDRTKDSRIYLGHTREYTGNELRRMLSWFKFEVLKSKYFRADPCIESHRTRLKIYNFIESIYPKWKSTILALAEKKDNEQKNCQKNR